MYVRVWTRYSVMVRKEDCPCFQKHTVVNVNTYSEQLQTQSRFDQLNELIDLLLSLVWISIPPKKCGHPNERVCVREKNMTNMWNGHEACANLWQSSRDGKTASWSAHGSYKCQRMMNGVATVEKDVHFFLQTSEESAERIPCPDPAKVFANTYSRSVE